MRQNSTASTWAWTRRFSIGGAALSLGITGALLAPSLLHQQPDAQAATRKRSKKRRKTTRKPVHKATPAASASRLLGGMKGRSGLGLVAYARQKADQNVNDADADFTTHIRLLDVAAKQDSSVVSGEIPPINSAEKPVLSYHEPALSPDGSRIAVVRETQYYDNASTLHDNADIWVMNVDGSDAVRLTSSPDSEAQPRWSPDGTRIAYRRQYSASGLHGVRVMNSDGSDNRPLLKFDLEHAEFGQTGLEESESPAWSPDGKRLAIVTIGGLCVVNADGSGLRELPEVAGRLNRDTSEHPSWSPDGEWIAFELGQAFQPPDAMGPDELVLYSSIYAVRADAKSNSSRPILLAGASTRDDPARATQNSLEDPIWLPDGRILFAWTQKNRADLWTMKADGSAKTRLTNTPGWDEKTPDAR